MTDPPLPYRHALQTYFGHRSLRGNQEPAVNALLSGRDILVTAPTGHGKSLCFQLPALVRHAASQPSGCVSLVVTPLVSLMQNQVSALRAKRIPAALLSSAEAESSNRRVLAALSSAAPIPFALLYVTPERLVTEPFLATLSRLYARNRVFLVAVDEAHCISQWGHDFRRAYAGLGVIKSRFPLIPIAALTATATPRVCRDILASLRIPAALHVHTSFLRANIRYEVRFADAMQRSVEDDIVAYVLARRLADGSTFERGIVYAFKRDTVDRVAAILNDNCVPAVAYHAGLSANNRKDAQTRFESGETPVVVASTAFGMGIDVAAIRYVIHHSVPKTVEAFYQESGRAGRDGLPSDSVLYYSERDAEFNAYLATKTYGAREEREERRVEAAVSALEAMKKYCTELKCRRVALLDYFGEKASPQKVCGPKGCDVCHDRNDVMRRMRIKVSIQKGGFRSAKRGARVATPAAEFQTARSLLRLKQEKENTEQEKGDKRLRSILTDDIEDYSSGDDMDPAAERAVAGLDSSEKPSFNLRALARAEERATAVPSRLKRPRDRLLARLNGDSVVLSSRSNSAKRLKGARGVVGLRKHLHPK